MAISDSAKVDLLYKKNFGLAKTDVPTAKSPSNETIASPALIRGDKIWAQASQIPSTPATVSGVVYAQIDFFRNEFSPDTSVGQINGIYKTWLSGAGGSNWISPEFGTGYQVEAYIAPTGTVDPKASGGIRIYQDGDASGGEFYFDYIAGVLNFIGNTMPSTFQANPTYKVFIYGYSYTGTTGSSNAGANNSLVRTTATGGIIATGTVSGNVVSATTTVTAPTLSCSTGGTTFAGATSGTATLKAPAVAGSNTAITLPSSTGTLIGTGDSGTVSNTMLATVQVAKGGTGLTTVASGNVLVGLGLTSNLGTVAYGTASTASSFVQRDANQVINVTNVVQTGYNNTTGSGTYTVPIGCAFLEGAGTPNLVITLPTGTTGKTIWIRNLTGSTGTITSASPNVYPKSGGTATSAILPATYGAWAMLVFTGTNWQIFASGT